MEIRQVDPQAGYDLWADQYDQTENPVVWIDGYAMSARVQVRPGERVLDAGCGTGRSFGAMLAQGAELVGVDFSAGMLRVARRKHPAAALVQADLQRGWPFRDGSFDTVVCALVGEHLGELDRVFGETRRVLRPGGRLIFSVYHPAMAAAGKEARYITGSVEYRLGAVKHVTDDYTRALEQAGFRTVSIEEIDGNEALAEAMPSQAKYVGFPMLLILEATAGVAP
jgi:ubiquinone/menaquinone biosynthesis C-methylase UbiE